LAEIGTVLDGVLYCISLRGGSFDVECVVAERREAKTVVRFIAALSDKP